MLCGLLCLALSVLSYHHLQKLHVPSSLSTRAQGKILVARASGAFPDLRAIGTLLGSSWSRSHVVNGPLTYMLEGLQGSTRPGKQAGLRGCWVHIIWHESWLVNQGFVCSETALCRPLLCASESSLTALWEIYLLSHVRERKWSCWVVKGDRSPLSSCISTVSPSWPGTWTTVWATLTVQSEQESLWWEPGT